MRNLAVGFVIGAGVGAGGCYVYLKTSNRLRDPTAAPTLWPAADPLKLVAVEEFGIPQTECIRVFDGYVAAFDYRTRNPKWVLEHLTKDSSEGDANRRDSKFFEDQGVDADFRSHLDDYRGSGYDRGHMAPAADFKSSQKAMDETFSLSNMSPQVGKGFNRDYWARLEKFVRDLTKRVEHVYVVTGPVWMPRPDSEGKWSLQHPLIGKPPGLVSVPTHYFKVIVADNRGKGKGKDGKVAVGAFLLPNAPIEPTMPLSAFTVPLEGLEKLAGVRFFPAFIDRPRRAAIDAAAQAWRQYGLEQLRPFDRISLAPELAALPPPSHTPAPTAAGTPAPLAAGAGTKPPATPVSNSNSSLNSNVAPFSNEAELVHGLPPPPPKTAGLGGTVHVCELNACSLAAEDFWKSRPGDGEAATGSGGGGGGGEGKGKKAPHRGMGQGSSGRR